MVREFIIFDLVKKRENKSFSLSLSPIEIKNRVEKTFDPDSLDWTISESENLIFISCIYDTRHAELKFEIFRKKNQENSIFQLTVLGGEYSFDMISTMLFQNTWKAIDVKTDEYFDDEKIARIPTTEKDKEVYFNEYWTKFNTEQDLIEQKRVEPKPEKSKWWKFW